MARIRGMMRGRRQAGRPLGLPGLVAMRGTHAITRQAGGLAGLVAMRGTRTTIARRRRAGNGTETSNCCGNRKSILTYNTSSGTFNRGDHPRRPPACATITTPRHSLPTHARLWCAAPPQDAIHRKWRTAGKPAGNACRWAGGSAAGNACVGQGVPPLLRSGGMEGWRESRG